jgi:kynurenine 3-monooxygenase
MRKEKIPAGRSINMAVSDRGWKALNKAGIEKDIKKMAIPMYGRMVHDLNEKTNLQNYGKEGQAIFSISRPGLNQKLLDYSEAFKNVNLKFNQKCTEIENNSVCVLNETNGKKDLFEFDLIFGADGAGSVVRKKLMKIDGKEFEEHFLEHGYKELSILPGKNGTHQLEKNALHIWPRKDFMLIALPNIDGSFTVTLFLPMKGSLSFEALDSPDKILNFFQNYFPDALARMPGLTEDFKTNPASILGYIKCSPWVYKDKIALIGIN